jgi:hypothetical protein
LLTALLLQAADSARSSAPSAAVAHTPKDQVATAPTQSALDGEEEDLEEISVDEAFLELSENGDGEFVTQEAVARWPLVADLLSEGYLQQEEFARMFQQASLQNAAAAEGEGEEVEVMASGAAGEVVLDYDGFNALLDLLDPFASDEVEEDASAEDAVNDIPAKSSTSVSALLFLLETNALLDRIAL